MNFNIENRPSGLLDSIPDYKQILKDLGRGNLKADFGLQNRRSKLCQSLEQILLDENNDELSYFVLFMDTKGSSNYVKFLLDLNNFEQALAKNKLTQFNSCPKCNRKINSIDQVVQANASQINSELVNSDCDCLAKIKKTIADDSLSIFSKYISKDANYSIDAPDDLINETIKNICPEEDKEINLNCFYATRDYIYNILEEKFYDKYVVSEYHCKYLVDILQNRSLNVSDILYDDIAVFFLLEYLEQEGCSELLKFWIQAENFSRNVLTVNERKSQSEGIGDVDALFRQFQNDAMVIYDNFISLQAKSPLGFDSIVRCQVEMNICQTMENLKENIEYSINSYADCFYVPMLIVFSILERVYFKKFLASTIYKKYKDEISINSSYLSSKMKKSPTKKNLSKTTISTPKEPKKKNPSNNSYNFLDDESLWARPQADNMQLGRIDLVTGRYIRNLKTEPDYEKDLDDEENERRLGQISKDARLSFNFRDDDIWTIENEQNQNTAQRDKLLKLNESSKLKSKLGRFINMIPLRSRTNEQDEQELAERFAAVLVNDVVRANNSQASSDGFKY